MSGVPVLHRSSMLNIAHLEHVARSEKFGKKFSSTSRQAVDHVATTFELFFRDFLNSISSNSYRHNFS